MKMIQKPSPNFEDRTTPVDMLVMHYTGMKSAQEALDRLCDPTPGKRVSAHYVVDEDGTVYQMVPEDKKAYHAGVSNWRGHTDTNNRSIGIEIVNPGHEFGYRPFPPAQMQAVAELAKGIIARHAIPAWNVVGHSDVAPERKEDPGELFDWNFLAGQGVGLMPQARAVPADGGLFSWVKRLFGAVRSSLATGSKGKEVWALQEDLSRIGYHAPPCGLYGKDTEAVVIAFQRHYRPTRLDGIWDSECQSLLADLRARIPAVTLSSPDGRMAAPLRPAGYDVASS